MSLFHSILSQIQEKLSKETIQTDQLAVVISEVIKTPISKDQLVVRGSTLKIQGAPTLKMTILLNKEKILNKVREINTSITTIV